MASAVASNMVQGPSLQMRDLSPAHLSRIFVLASSDDASTALALSHIDTATRAIALHTPAMWSVLDSAISLAGLREFAVRAGGPSARFDIRVAPSIAQRASIATIVSIFVDAVKPFASQWRSLTINVPVADWMDGFFALLADITTVDIDRLVLRVNSSGIEEDYFKRGPEAARTIPRVPFAPKVLVLDGVPAFQTQMFGPRLEDLVIRNMRLPVPPHNHKHARNGTVMVSGRALLDLLRSTSNLRTFALTASHPEPEAIETRLNLPELINLAVCGAFSAQFALGSFAPAALRTLDIEWAPSSSVVQKKTVKNEHADLLSFIAQGFSNLTRLRIATIAQVDEGTWAALFISLPHLEHLTLEAITGPPALAALRTTQPPHLAELTLRHIDDIHVIQVAQVVASRLGFEHQGVTPIRVLQVLWCEQLDTGAAERLREGVPYVIHRDVNEDDEDDLDFAMDEMQIEEGSSEEDWEDGDHDDSYMDEEDDEEDDIAAELAMLREDNKLNHDPRTSWS